MGVAGVQDDSTVHLLGSVHADPSADVASQFVGASTLPAAREEAVLEALLVQQIALEVVAAVAADPGPLFEGVEAAVGSIEGIAAFLRHG